MLVEFTPDTTIVDEEISLLESCRESMAKGYLEAGRADDMRLVFRTTPAGRAHIKSMISEDKDA